MTQTFIQSPDLSRSALYNADLSHANLNHANLSHANLSYANLNNANLNDAHIRGAYFFCASLDNAYLCNADLRGAHLGSTNIRSANLIYANLRRADLSNADLSHANLYYASLSNANLNRANLSGANLSNANLSRANLSGANLHAAQALVTSFNTAILTGACIQDWSINSDTDLKEIICEYVFNKYDYKKRQFTDRRPHDPNQIFAPGEFTKRYQVVLESVELFFNDGIDWRAFLASLHDLQIQYGGELSIQTIGRKAGGTFVVQLEVPLGVNKGAIERQAKELYESKLQSLEACFQERLQLQGEQLSFFQKQVEIERVSNTRLERIIETMAEKESSKYDLRGAKFGGGFAAEGSTQMGGMFNDFSQAIEQNKTDIESLIKSLRGIAEAFPQDQRTEAIEHLEDLETDLEQPPEKRKQSRMKAALVALMGVTTVIGGAVAGANEFATQVQELSDKLGIPLPIEQVEPLSSQKNAIDVKAIGSD